MVVTKSSAFCLPGIFKCLEKIAGQHDWSGSSEQMAFLARYESAFADLPDLEDHLETISSADPDVLGSWFSQRGFTDLDITLSPGCMGIGSFFNLHVEWRKTGIGVSIQLEENFYHGVELSPQSAFMLDGHDFPLFQLETNQDWKVFLTESDQQYPSRDLPARGNELLQKKRTALASTKLRFPMVELDIHVDIDFLTGMKAHSNTIVTAKKKTKLRLDEKGAKAQAAVFMPPLCGGPRIYCYTIIRPFFVIFWKEGLDFPPFIAHVTPKHWIEETDFSR
ncbi:hypothetical protein KKH43_00490 [Patescibacteria group bacterium]|nr:hypothetical protein [Patescibacteria group bacterium]